MATLAADAHVRRVCWMAALARAAELEQLALRLVHAAWCELAGATRPGQPVLVERK